MKRKLALLLAAVMTLSMLPMNVFASTSNSVTSSTTVIPKKSVLYEVGSDITRGEVDTRYNDKIEYKVEGGDLVLTTNDYIQEGDTFRLTLENAKWFFRSNRSVDQKPASAAALSVLHSLPNSASVSSKDYNTNVSNGATYNDNKGIWYVSDGATGVYYKYADFSRGAAKEIPFSMNVSAISDKEAIIKVLGIDNNYLVANGFPAVESTGFEDTTNGQDKYYYGSSGDRYQIRIPLVTLSTEDNADLRIRIGDSNTARITSNTTHTFGVAGSALTKATIGDPQSARDSLKLDKIIVKETRISSIGNGEFSINTPSGFYFGGTPVINIESGLSGGAGSTAWYTEDNTILHVKLEGLTKSTDILGAVFVTGLTLYPDDDSSYWGDVNLTIKNTISNNRIVTNESFKAGTRVDWTISLTTEGTIPELVSGRYKQYEQNRADDDLHKTARVVFAENSFTAWWAETNTTFILPEGVKYRKVEFTDQSNLLEEGDYNYANIKDEIFYNEKSRNGKSTVTGTNATVTIDGNKMTLNNFRVKKDEKAKLKFDVWVSIEAGFKGDVTMGVEGRGIPAQGEDGAVPLIVIAKQISPVTVSTKITDIKIGYQLQPTADVVITETKAGNLLKDKTVNVSVTDYAGYASEVSFSPDTKVAVTDGDMRIKNIRISRNSAASSSALSTTSGTLQYDIDRVSTKASTVTISNASIKIDRTVPESNDRPYSVVVWGTAIAENYDNTADAPNDTFSTPGVSADYVRVISSANDKSSLLSQRVVVAIGETTYTVNGETFEMDAAAYISPSSNSTLVPVRFISKALGIPEGAVLWSDSTKQVTIMHTDRTVQFTGNSDVMVIDGVTITNYSPDGLKVSAEITGDRMYVPFRALGDAFGVPVEWDQATGAAIYNPDVEVKTTAE